MSRSSAGSAASDGESRIWGAIVDRVLAPAASSPRSLPAGLLVGLAAPALQLRLGMNGPDTLPKSLPVVQAYDRMQQAFPGAAIPATVVVKAPNVNAPAVRTAIAQLERRAHASGRVHGPITVDVNADATVANITVPIDGTGADRVSNAAVAALRSDDRAADGGRAAEHRGRRHGLDGPVEGRQPTRRSRSSRSWSASCSCSRSR